MLDEVGFYLTTVMIAINNIGKCTTGDSLVICSTTVEAKIRLVRWFWTTGLIIVVPRLLVRLGPLVRTLLAFPLVVLWTMGRLVLLIDSVPFTSLGNIHIDFWKWNSIGTSKLRNMVFHQQVIILLS